MLKRVSFFMYPFMLCYKGLIWLFQFPFFASTIGQQPFQSQEKADEVEDQTLQEKTKYRWIGEGEPIIVLHDGPGMLELANRYQIIFFDDPKEDFEKEIEKLVTKLDLISFHLIGGSLAFHYARQEPSKVRSLILTGPCDTSLSIKEIKVPSLIIQGDRDPHAFKNAKHASERVVFENCGRMPHIEYPERFFTTIESFLRQLPSRG